MKLQVSLPDADIDAVHDLHRWLHDDPHIRQSGSVPALTSGDAPGDMGTGLAVLSLIIGTGLSTLQLLLAIAQWRASRHRAPVVIVTTPAGNVARVDSAESDLEQLARLLDDE